MNWLQSVFYGFISGLADFLPISSRAHQDILISLFGFTRHDPVRDFLIDLAVICALFFNCKELFSQIGRDGQQTIHNYRTYRKTNNSFVVRLVKTATIPMVLGMLVFSYIFKRDYNLLSATVLLLINGIILYIPCRLMQGNKDALSMSVFDSCLIGLSGALGVFSGFSRLGCITSAAIIRGADRQKAMNWALLLSVPGLVLLTGLDFLEILFNNQQIPFFSNLFGYLLSLIAAGIGASVSIALLRFVTRRTDYRCFAYYSWGASLFSFILYLTVV